MPKSKDGDDFVEVFAFGRGLEGQLGQQVNLDNSSPSRIEPLDRKRIVQIACGDAHVLARSSDGQVYSWGCGGFGRLGHGDTLDKSTPTLIQRFAGLRVDFIAAGGCHSAAVANGCVYTWGMGREGQLGHGDTKSRTVPSRIDLLLGTRVRSVACGDSFCMAVTEAKELYSWGWGSHGRLGHNDTNQRLFPTLVSSPSLSGVRIVQVACGWRHSVAVSESGDAYSWGWNTLGQLGLGDIQDRYVPTLIESFHHISASNDENSSSISASSSSASFSPSASSSSSPSSSHVRIKQVACGQSFSLALDDQGNVFSFGDGECGNLGTSNCSKQLSPIALESIPFEYGRVISIACGAKHGAAVTETGHLLTWGLGSTGQLGHGNQRDQIYPTSVSSLRSKRFETVACGRDFTLALTQHAPEVSFSAVPIFEDFRKLIDNATFSDVEFLVMPPPRSISCPVTIRAHSAILSARSPRFAAILSSPSGDAVTAAGTRVIRVDQDLSVGNSSSGANMDAMDAATLRQLLEYIYTGACRVPRASLPTILAAAERYEITSLISRAREAAEEGSSTFVASSSPSSNFVLLSDDASLSSDMMSLVNNKTTADVIFELRNPSSAQQQQSQQAAAAAALKRQMSFSELYSMSSSTPLPSPSSSSASSASFASSSSEDSEIAAHRCILSARCPTFFAMFNGGMSESIKKQQQQQQPSDGSAIRVPVSVPGGRVAFLELLNYLYTSKVEITGDHVFDLLSLADEYGCEGLREQCEGFLKEHVTLENILDLLHLSDRFNAPQLKRFCMFFVSKEFETLQRSDAYKALPSYLKGEIETQQFGPRRRKSSTVGSLSKKTSPLMNSGSGASRRASHDNKHSHVDNNNDDDYYDDEDDDDADEALAKQELERLSEGGFALGGSALPSGSSDMSLRRRRRRQPQERSLSARFRLGWNDFAFSSGRVAISTLSTMTLTILSLPLIFLVAIWGFINRLLEHAWAWYYPSSSSDNNDKDKKQ